MQGHAVTHSQLVVSHHPKVVRSSFFWLYTLRGSILNLFHLTWSKSLNLCLFSAWRPTRENLVQRRPKPLQLWTCRMGSVRGSLLRSKLLYGKGKGRPSPPMRSCVQKPLPLRLRCPRPSRCRWDTTPAPAQI